MVKAGLWERDVRLTSLKDIDFSAIYTVAEEQGVVGLVTAGLENIHGTAVSKDVALSFVGGALQIEQRNKLMNSFIAELIAKMRRAGIYTLLVKGQGIAQCYERPLWRPAGDIDFLLSKDNYIKAKQFLLPLSSSQKNEERYSLHLGMSIDPWYVEMHGSLRTGLSGCVDNEIDEVLRDIFYRGSVRSWMNNSTQVFLPAPNNDVFLVFTHFIKHFYKEGMSLRQICDWCRLLWTFRGKIDVTLLEKRLKRARLMDEWRGFATLAVDYLGMPVEAMPLYSAERKWHVKGEKIMRFILDKKESGKIGQTLAIAKIFPGNIIKFSPSIFFHLNWLKIKERVFGNGNR